MRRGVAQRAGHASPAFPTPHSNGIDKVIDIDSTSVLFSSVFVYTESQNVHPACLGPVREPGPPVFGLGGKVPARSESATHHLRPPSFLGILCARRLPRLPRLSPGTRSRRLSVEFFFVWVDSQLSTFNILSFAFSQYSCPQRSPNFFRIRTYRSVDSKGP